MHGGVEKKIIERRVFSRFRTIVAVLVLLPMLSVFALHIFQNIQQRQTRETLLTERVMTLSRLITANEEAFVKHAQQLLVTLAGFPFLVSATDEPFASTHLANLVKLSPNYQNFGLIERDGTLFASAVPATGDVRRLSDRAYFRRALESRSFSLGDFQTSRITGERALNFALPIMGPSNHVQRVLFSSLKIGLLTEAAQRIELPPGAMVTIIDRTGTVLARFPDSQNLVGQSMIEVPFVREALRTGAPLIRSTGIDGVKRLYALTSLSDSTGPKLFVLVGMPTAVLFAEAKHSLLVNLLVLCAITGLSLLISSLVAERILVKPVDQLVHAAHRLADGDLGTRLAVNQKAAELRELSEAFNQMSERLQSRDSELSKAAHEIQRMNSELEEKVHQRTAELENANKELESFSYSVSHDLRAPLRHLDGFAQLLLKHQASRVDDKGKRYLEVIAGAAKKMGSLIDELLLFSRMSRQALNRTAVDFNKMILEIRGELESEKTGPAISWRIEALPPASADPALIRQVWLNLLSNAIKYSSRRETPVIEVGSHASDNAVERIFFVRDNGVGFDMNFVGKLFGVFQRLHSDAEFEGTGIGLANVRRIVQRHGGRTWAEGKIGEGATFYFSLPCRDELN